MQRQGDGRTSENGAAKRHEPARAGARPSLYPTVVNDRFTFGEGAMAWVYRYRKAISPFGGRLSTGLEVAVQLHGDWHQESRHSGRRLYVSGDIHTINHGEPYAHHATPAPKGTGLQVGFALHPDASVARGPIARLLVVGHRGGRDTELTAFAQELAHAPADVRPRLVGQGQAVLRRYVHRNGELVPQDGLFFAREELGRHFRSPLYLRHIADVAGMHPTTFSRTFARRFGITPIQYRLKMRLNHAATLAWLKPQMTILELAAESGFNDISYFHRAFRRYMGVTPAHWRLYEL